MQSVAVGDRLVCCLILWDFPFTFCQPSAFQPRLIFPTSVPISSHTSRHSVGDRLVCCLILWGFPFTFCQPPACHSLLLFSFCMFIPSHIHRHFLRETRATSVKGEILRSCSWTEIPARLLDLDLI